MMTIWEYKVETFYYHEDAELEQHLKKRGGELQWWELINYRQSNRDPTYQEWGAWLLFKRQSPTQMARP